MKIYTKTGDDGTTGLFGGGRVRKDDARVDAYGTVDELNAVVGVARTLGLGKMAEEVCAQVQVDLFALGGELTVPGKEDKLPMTRLGESDAARLEQAIDAAEVGLPALTNFILPGGSEQAAMLHLARTVCRRAERLVIGLGVRSELVIYLNRLSYFSFVLARRENHERKIEDVPWVPRES